MSLDSNGVVEDSWKFCTKFPVIHPGSGPHLKCINQPSMIPFSKTAPTSAQNLSSPARSLLCSMVQGVSTWRYLEIPLSAWKQKKSKKGFCFSSLQSDLDWFPD